MAEKRKSDEKHLEFHNLVLPVMEWLDKNHHPHTKIILDSTRAELVEGLIWASNPKYLK